MVANHLMLSTKAEEDGKDDLLSALTVLAYPTPQVNEVRKKKKKLIKKEVPKEVKKHRSRFFYKPTVSIAEEVAIRKETVVPTTSLETINGEVDSRVKTYVQELPNELQQHIETVREFFIKEIAPRTLAVQGGTAQALDVVQKTINSAIDPQPFAQFERM